MSITSKSRGIFLCSSSVLTIICIGILTAAVFSTSYRYVSDQQTIKGARYFGLFRYCYYALYEPDKDKTCNLRVHDNSVHGPGTQLDWSKYYSDFEMATLILLCFAIAVGLLGICFAICTIFTPFGAFAHSVCLLTAAIAAAAGFFVYTYFNELRENQTMTIAGVLLDFHFAWAYYWTGGAAGVLVFAFILSLFGSAMVVVHKKQKNRIETSNSIFMESSRNAMPLHDLKSKNVTKF